MDSTAIMGQLENIIALLRNKNLQIKVILYSIIAHRTLIIVVIRPQVAKSTKMLIKTALFSPRLLLMKKKIF